MQDKEKLIYLEFALRMQNIGLEKKTLHRIIKTYDKILIKKGDTDLKDIASIEGFIQETYKTK